MLLDQMVNQSKEVNMLLTDVPGTDIVVVEEEEDAVVIEVIIEETTDVREDLQRMKTNKKKMIEKIEKIE